MRKITLLIASLFIAIGAMAQIQTSTEYRIKEKSTEKYLTVGGASANQYGEVYGTGKNEDNEDQIFTFIDAGGGQFYLKSNSGEYISYYGDGQGWNVNSDASESNAHALIFEPQTDVNEYKIKCYNASKNDYKYFKWEWVGVSGFYHPFNDSDAGAIFVLEQVNIPEYNVTYKYQYNGEIVKTVTHQVVQGNSYPSADLNLYAAEYEGVPTGTVTEDTECTITISFGEMLFEYYESYEAVVEANGWYNLVMHSNQNTGNGTDKYRTYLGAGNETSLAWGENKTLLNPNDEYYWGFVGDPINGFKVVNKSAAGKILSSNGTSNPVLLTENGLADGYNTTWGLAARKYKMTDNGDFVKMGDWFCLKHANGSYLNANAGNGTVAFWSDNDNGSGILAVRPIEIKAAADVATYFSEAAISVPEIDNLQVYYADRVENDWVKLESIEGIVYPETGIVVKYDTEYDITFAPAVMNPGTTQPENLLKGTTKRTLIAKEGNYAYYALGMVDGVVGFYNAVNGDNQNEFYNGAFKAYLKLPVTQGAAAFYGFNFDETTGVEEVEVESTVKTIYDLSGRKVSGMSAPGLYIVNGKKVLVK